MRASAGAVLIVAALMVAACNGPERTYALPAPPLLAEPTTPPPVASDQVSRPGPVYTPPAPTPSWMLMPSQRTSCGRNFC
jgi:hypothetical protein